MAAISNKTRQKDDRFLARMESQCFQIERYRWEVRRTEGRLLSQDEAAREWIQRYAADFARDANADS